MKLFQSLSMMLVVLGAGALAACSSGSSNLLTDGRNLCPDGLNWKPATLGPNQKSINPDPAALEIDPGEYTYQNADLFYFDQINKLSVDFDDQQAEDGTFKASISCLKNATPNMKNISLHTVGVNHMIIDKTGKATIDTYDYNFNMDDGGINPDFKPDQTGQEKSPKDVYDGIDSSPQFVNMNTATNTNYEMRSAGTTPRGYFTLVVRFIRKPPSTLSPIDWFNQH